MKEHQQHHSDRLLIFELGYGGHYPSYIGYLCDYWRKQQTQQSPETAIGQLVVVVSPQFMQNHQDVVQAATRTIEASDRNDFDLGSDSSNAPEQGKLDQTELEDRGKPAIEFVSISQAEASQLTPRTSPPTRAKRALQEWQLLAQYAQRLEATHCLLLYIDSFQTAIAMRQKLPCPFSGIYFRPTFHYCDFADYAPSYKEKLQSWRERLMLPRVLHHPQLHTFFCLDPFAIKPINHLTNTTKAVYLPDPVRAVAHTPAQMEQFRYQLAIEPQRTSFLLFGAIYDRRKGLPQILAALMELDAKKQAQICLVLAGQLFRSQKPDIDQLLNQLAQNTPVQLVIRDQYISEAEMKLFYASADVILAAYQKHVGMSGIVVEAAAAGRPLICSNYGLMGQIVRQYHLGITVDATKPIAIAQAIEKYLTTPLEKLADRDQMQNYAAQNSTIQFTRTIFGNLT
ncbi:glycosyl transferase group 1 [Thalassoporum mexicanum PCC 7367]|uniref:glycosyltransferase n=1 Tax=Thalassoporum mexicanum TaxID=3457544 RepID=UPI00029FD464|nr:glycosyltransferase [Pseudanabaena sp. PCC 7367]AFY71008.1 glycosyl transferase group 1 [Pseudanabaena sp. PCC 7367]